MNNKNIARRLFVGVLALTSASAVQAQEALNSSISLPPFSFGFVIATVIATVAVLYIVIREFTLSDYRAAMERQEGANHAETWERIVNSAWSWFCYRFLLPVVGGMACVLAVIYVFVRR